MVTDQGVSPRVLFVGEVDNSVSVNDAIHVSDTLTLTGEGFGMGSHAWAFTGLAREPIPLEIESETSSEIVLVIHAKLDTTQPVDVVLVTNGRQLVVIDALDRVLIDTAAPIDTGNPKQNGDTASQDTGNAQTGLEPGPGCGCRQVTLAATFLPALLSLTFPLVRRET